MKTAPEPVVSSTIREAPSRRTLRGLDWLNFFLADVQTGVGPFLAIYLAGYGWNEQRVGLALTVGGIAGILTQTPAGGLVDRLRSKRALITAGIVALAAGALLIAFVPTVSVLVIADLTEGTGRFNLTLGAISTAVGIGASLSQVIAGTIVHQFGSNAGFFFLAGIATAALGILYFFMPETRNERMNPPV
jgi:MFS family permease